MDVLNLSQVPQSPPGHLPSWWWDLSLLLWCISQRGTENLPVHFAFPYHLSHMRQYYLKHVAESFRRRMAICFLSSHRRRFSISVISVISVPWPEWLSPICFRWSIEVLDRWFSNGTFYEFFCELTETQELWILHSTGCSFCASWIIAHLKKGELISLNYVLASLWLLLWSCSWLSFASQEGQ